jgi:alpha-1,2-mannosyltransferase
VSVSALTTPARGRLSSERARVWGMAVRHACFGLVPFGFTLYIGWVAVKHHSFAIDFHYAFWPAGQKVLHGLTPYVATTSPLVKDGVAFVYPAPGALLFAVLALIPHALADVIFTAISLVAATGVLWILRIRDWRLYGLILLWPSVLSGWQTANLSLLIAFGIAAVWRLRDRPRASGAIVGLLVALKMFAWPLGLWLLATRRYAAVGWGLATVTVVNVFSWAVLGFNQLHAYETLASAVTKVEEKTAYTPLALVWRLGASLTVAQLIAVALAAATAIHCVRQGRRGRDVSSLLLAIGVSLLATPIVWRHYFALFLVPLAIVRPRFSAIWLLPLLLLPTPVTSPLLWQLVLTLVVMTLLAMALIRQSGELEAERRDKLRWSGFSSSRG